VDKNPLAAEMAKLSLWLLTLAKYKPFTFLDHAIRCGDSLVGIRDIRQVQYFQLDLDHADRSLFAGPVMGLVDEAVALRKKIEALPANTVEDVREKERLLAEAEKKTARLRLAADLLISVEFQPVSSAGEKEALHNSMAIQAGHYVQNGSLEDFRAAAKKVMNGQPTFHWPLELPEVMLDRGGFDALVCNPPFLGGIRISGVLQTDYLRYLQCSWGGGNRADLCAYFFLRARELTRDNGAFGLVATNTISQGDTREFSLERLTNGDCAIIRANPSLKWPGTANLEVALVWCFAGVFEGEKQLDNIKVKGITPHLSQSTEVVGKPFSLRANDGLSFKGSDPLGIGFIIEADEANMLISKDNTNATVIRPFLNGEDLTGRPDQSPSRWAIDFRDWPLDRSTAPDHYEGPVASEYPDCMAIVEERVKPARQRKNAKGKFVLGKPLPQKWWLFNRPRIELYSTIANANCERIIVRPEVSSMHVVVSMKPGILFSNLLCVFPLEDWHYFSVLQSTVHEVWSRFYGSTLETRMRYTPSDCFGTYPFTQRSKSLGDIESSYHLMRSQIMHSRSEGLTKTYNRFHNPAEAASEIQKLRVLHVEMDNAVAVAYGWDDIDLGHGFHETKQGTRFTISESARREVLSRLLKLNHERYAEEVKQGLHDKRGKAKPASSRKGRKSNASTSTPSFKFGNEEDDPDPAEDTREDPTPTQGGISPKAPRADRQVQPTTTPEPPARPTPIDEIDTNEIMAAFRQAARNRGWLDRDELLKEVSLVLGYQRLGPKTDESLRGHLRAAIRRRIIDTDGPTLVRAGAVSMADYEPDELVEVFRSVMRKGTTYDREEVIPALARHLGFVRLTDGIREPIRKTINRAIRQGLLGYEGSLIWRA
jgi:hypothetical protein